MLRTLLRAALVAAVFATLLLPVTPAAAVSAGTYSLTTSPVSFTRSNQTFQLTISALQSNEGTSTFDSMTATISKVSNPKGVAWARQQQTYSWYFNGDRFNPTYSSTKATLKTSAEMGDYGNLAVTFTKSGTVNEYCSKTIKQWPGSLSGTVTLNTGSSMFGSIKAVPAKATLTHNTDTKCYAVGHAKNACPTPGVSVGGYRFGTGSRYSSVSGNLPANTLKPGNLFFSASSQLPTSKTNADGYLGRLVMANVPRSDVAIGSGLASATLQGEPGTWVSGTATFAANAKAYTGEPWPCAGGKESVHTSRSGMMNGGLAANTWVGADITVGSDMPASAYKTIVRAQ